MITSTVTGQTKNSITADFISDSTGCLGLRMQHAKDTSYQLKRYTKGEVLFDGKSIIGKSKQEVILLLGEPNFKSGDTAGKRKKTVNEVFFTMELVKTTLQEFGWI